MGKPFEKELNQLDSCFAWANEIDIKTIQDTFDGYSSPVYVVGSGGSLSACYFAANLFTLKGIISKAITPLELFYAKASLKNANIIFISASGKNTDILFGFKTAVTEEPISIINICMKRDTKLKEIASKYSNCQTIEFDCPTGKDGFLATNSLIAYFTILYRTIAKKKVDITTFGVDQNRIENFIHNLENDTTICVLYSNYSQPVAIDIESKCTEAGLGHIILSDYRNFAHGRHHWFDKQKKSAIIALQNPMDKELCDRTIDLLPKSISRLFIKSDNTNYDGAIQLLVQSFYLINALGKKLKIDPGRPGVPEYGSKIYNLKYESIINLKKTDKNLSQLEEIAILRKTKITRIEELNQEQLSFWPKAYKANLKKLSTNKFGCIIFDYDGTLCSLHNRFDGLDRNISDLLIRLLKQGIVVGVVSGRGKSLRTDLDKIFSEATNYLKNNVILGYYNGSDIAGLLDDSRPDKIKPMHKSLEKVKKRLQALNISFDESPNQLTIGTDGTVKWGSFRSILLNEIMLLNLPDIQMVESSHSIDILPRKEGCKNNIIKYCIEKCKSLNISENFLCIGDKGLWPGNDYALLSNPFSISVDEVSGSADTGWNICPAGISNTEGLMYLQNKFKLENGYFTLQLL